MFTPSLFLFFNIGAPELFIIVLVVIVFFGSKKIPELMKGLGKGIREFKDATGEIQQEIKKSSKIIEDELKDKKSSSGDQQKVKKSSEVIEDELKDQKSSSGEQN